jgi:hypothetical protein
LRRSREMGLVVAGGSVSDMTMRRTLAGFAK